MSETQLQTLVHTIEDRVAYDYDREDMLEEIVDDYLAEHPSVTAFNIPEIAFLLTEIQEEYGEWTFTAQEFASELHVFLGA